MDERMPEGSNPGSANPEKFKGLDGAVDCVDSEALSIRGLMGKLVAGVMAMRDWVTRVRGDESKAELPDVPASVEKVTTEMAVPKPKVLELLAMEKLQIEDECRRASASRGRSHSGSWMAAHEK